MKFKFDNNIPIYIQLVEQLKISIISGQLKPGERLPSVRELALQTGINPNTVQRGLVELEELKLIFTESTNGKYVTKNEKLIIKHKEEYAKNLSNKFFEDMMSIGYNKSEIINGLKDIGGNK